MSLSGHSRVQPRNCQNNKMADDSRNRDRCKFNRNRSGRNRHSPRNDFSESSTSSKPFKGRPRNLRGKDIGMFYANRQRLRKQENDKGRPVKFV